MTVEQLAIENGTLSEVIPIRSTAEIVGEGSLYHLLLMTLSDRNPHLHGFFLHWRPTKCLFVPENTAQFSSTITHVWLWLSGQLGSQRVSESPKIESEHCGSAHHVRVHLVADSLDDFLGVVCG